MTNNLINISAFLFLWSMTGRLSTLIKKEYWHKVLIKKNIASKYPDFNETPLKVLLPIILIYPIQSVRWYWYTNKSDGKSVIPIIPIDFDYYPHCNKGDESVETTPHHVDDEENILENVLKSMLKSNVTKSYINHSLIHNHKHYFNDKAEDFLPIDKNRFIKEQSIIGELSGLLHLFFWIAGILAWIICTPFVMLFQIIPVSLDKEQQFKKTI